MTKLKRIQRMLNPNSLTELSEGRRQRFLQIVERIRQQGLTRKDIARRLGLGTSYFSDISSGRREVSELTARRIGDEFNVDFQWLRNGIGGDAQPVVRLAPPAAVMELPVLQGLCTGDPLESVHWSGGKIDVAGPGAEAARRATHPYVFRIPAYVVDVCHFKEGDLVLISQSDNPSASFGVIRMSGGPEVAIKDHIQKMWKALGGDVKDSRRIRLGWIMGVIWSSL